MAEPSGPPPIPPYGEGTLADLARSLFAALGVRGLDDPLGLGRTERVCLLLVDGLGWEQLRAGGQQAPLLWELASDRASRPLAAPFPATTATSLACLGTGAPPGDHGIVGYTFAVPGHDRAMNALRWELYGSGPQVDLRRDLEPETVQPLPTLFERAAEDGVASLVLGRREHASSGLTRAVLRGADHRGVHGLGDLAAETVAALTDGHHRFVLAYHDDLDTTAHVRGVGSDGWGLHLGHVDRLVGDVVERLPAGSTLCVTGDHGLLDVPRNGRLDLGDAPELLDGVRLVAGEGRARHVYARPGAAAAVLEAWRDGVGARMWVRSREQAVDEAWFGPTVGPEAARRIGDVVAAAAEPFAVFQRSVDALQAELIGHHGSMTADEQMVPCLVHRA